MKTVRYIECLCSYRSKWKSKIETGSLKDEGHRPNRKLFVCNKKVRKGVTGKLVRI